MSPVIGIISLFTDENQHLDHWNILFLLCLAARILIETNLKTDNNLTVSGWVKKVWHLALMEKVQSHVCVNHSVYIRNNFLDVLSHFMVYVCKSSPPSSSIHANL